MLNKDYVPKISYMIDPPEGWQYGFPRAYHGPDSWPDTNWFLDNGYPQSLIDQGMLKYCRGWETPIENSNRRYGK